MKLLLVEDEIQLSKSLKKILMHNDYNVDIVSDGQTALDYFNTYDYDLIILDIMLPKINGVEVLKKIRLVNKNVKIIMLSAKTLVSDKVECLNLEADDYLSKPFSSDELLARIKSNLRRRDVIINEYVFSNMILDINSHKISNGIDEYLLGKKEFLIMKILFENKNQIITKENLLNKVWESCDFVNESVLWTYISFLRKKLALLNSKIEINISRGVGYSLGEKHD